jgi:hypothetical protein
MRKLFVLSIVALLISVVSICGIAKKSEAIWDGVDLTHVYGGCVQYADIAQCGGDAAECIDTLCGVAGGPDGTGNYICPPFGYDSGVPHRRLVVRVRDSYYPSVRPVESSGRTSSAYTDVVCQKDVKCAATSCTPGEVEGEYRCSEESSKDVKVKSHTLTGPGC